MTLPSEPFEVSEARIKYGNSSWEGFRKKEMITPHMASIIMKRAFELISGHEPIKASSLYGTLGGDFNNITKQDLHATIDEMVRKGVIIQMSYTTVNTSGKLYFPAETKFEFNGYGKMTQWK